MTLAGIQPLLSAANAPLDDPERNLTIGDGPPRFELYHFALSLCSQKVRATLMETGAPFRAHDINIQPGNYHPDYIRLRLCGAPDGTEFAIGYTGRSAVETEGFDPAVVPTLVDLDSGEVVTDSVRICRHIDAATGSTLVPEAEARLVASEVAIVDGSPHVAFLYGAHPEGDIRPARLQKGMAGVHDRKIAKLEAALKIADDDLRPALAAKIAKEAAGRDFVHDPASMRAAFDEMTAIVAALDDRLSDGRPFVCGGDFTLADIMWSVSLFRLKWIGAAFLWKGDHSLNASPQAHVAAYGARMFVRPAFVAANIDWPLVPRSEFVMDHYPNG